jgi:hypothetical protein
MEWGWNMSGAFLTLAGVAVGFALGYLKSYFSESGKLDATIARLDDMTTIVEDIKTKNAKQLADLTHQNDEVLEGVRAMNQLRMAALERRLQAHQEAFALWREVLGATHTDEIGNAVLKCQDWWENNCLYLDPKVRDAFVSAYSAAHVHRAYVQGRAEASVITGNWQTIAKFPDILFESIQLPPLSEKVATKVLTNTEDVAKPDTMPVAK